MRNYILTILALVFCSMPMMAQTTIEKANAEYGKDNYAVALQLYQQAAQEEGTSSDLYYNMGNTYYRMGDLGCAVLNYERALILNPHNDEAKENLEFVNSKIQTKITDEKSFVLQVIENFVTWQTSNTWATIAAVCFVLLVVGILLYAFSSVIALRKLGFFGGGVMLIVVTVALMCAYSVKSKVEAKNKAVITVPSVTLSTVPRVPKDKNEEAFILTAGNKVTVVDSVENSSGDVKIKWYNVKADASHRAWLKAENLEKI